MNDNNNDNINNNDKTENQLSDYTEQSVNNNFATSEEIEQSTENLSQQTTPHQQPLSPPIGQKIKAGNTQKIVITTSLASLAIIILAMVIPSYEFVSKVSTLVLFGGPVVALVLGIIVAKSTIRSIKNKSLAHSTGQNVSKTTPLQAIIVGILVFLGIFVSYAITFFIVALFLGQRACELSGSSKCY